MYSILDWVTHTLLSIWFIKTIGLVSASTDPAVFYVSFIIMYLHTSTTSTIVMLIDKFRLSPTNSVSCTTTCHGVISRPVRADRTTIPSPVLVYIIQFQLYKGQAALAVLTSLDDS